MQIQKKANLAYCDYKDCLFTCLHEFALPLSDWRMQFCNKNCNFGSKFIQVDLKYFHICHKYHRNSGQRQEERHDVSSQNKANVAELKSWNSCISSSRKEGDSKGKAVTRIIKFCYLQPADLRDLFSKTNEDQRFTHARVPAECSPKEVGRALYSREAVSRACH